MIIRTLEENDRKKVIDFYNTLGEDSAGFFNVNRGNEKRTLSYLDGEKPDHLFYVAQSEDGEIAGIVFIWDTDRTVPRLGICVHDKFQHMGIGSSLIKYIEEKVEAQGGGGILLTTAKTNIKAQGLYEKYGFERIGVHPSGEYLYIYRIKKGERIYD